MNIFIVVAHVSLTLHIATGLQQLTTFLPDAIKDYKVNENRTNRIKYNKDP